MHDDHIRARAYFIYEDRVRQNIPGDEVGDWLRAEHELETAADRAIEAMIAGGARERVTSGGQW
ncbi:MAG: DUF2934 domain-containing protein [Phycisphaera sp.]|nr:MAG: DUF2934 domain-containing protein [Phycisphaera sp.]